MKRQILVLSVTILFGLTIQQSYAQLPNAGTGPGGIGNKSGTNGHPQNIIWLRADKGVEVEYDGNGDPTSTVLTWYDQSGNSKNAVSTANGTKPLGYSYTLPAGKPQIEYNKLNGRPWLRFGTSGGFATLIIPDQDADPIQIDGCNNMCLVFVFKRSNVPDSGTFERIIMKWNESGADHAERAFAVQFDGGAKSFQFNSNYNGYQGPAPRFDIYSNKKIKDTTQTYLFLQNYRPDFGTSYNVYMYLNGGLEAYSSYSSPINDADAPFVISPTMKGCFAEIIMYRNGLNDAQSVILQNALAAKYGITLASGKQIYNNSAYSSDVIGIGRGSENTGYFYQKASRGGNLILYGDTTTIGKNEFLMAGHDTAQVITADGNGNWSREWYFELKGSLSARVYFDFRNTGFSIDSTEAKAYNLYYSADGNFYSVLDTNGTLVDSTVMFNLSTPTTGFYKIGKLTNSTVADPVIDVTGSPYTGTAVQPVNITCATGGASIYYTLDGSEPYPGKDSTRLYTGTITIPLGFRVLKARAFISLGGGYFASNKVSSTYLLTPAGQVSAPVFNPLPGPYSTGQTVTITSATNNAVIYYTTDGSTPDSASGILYTAPINITSNLVLKAIAYEASTPASPVSVGSYIIGGVKKIDGSAGKSLVVYPNPASGTISIEAKGLKGKITLRIYSTTGSLVKVLETQTSGDLTESIDISDLTPGIYMLEATDSVTRKTLRFIKQ